VVKKNDLNDDVIRVAVDEISKGLYEARLDGLLYKKRVGIKGKEKQGGARTIIAFKKDDKVRVINK